MSPRRSAHHTGPRSAAVTDVLSFTIPVLWIAVGARTRSLRHRSSKLTRGRRRDTATFCRMPERRHGAVVQIPSSLRSGTPLGTARALRGNARWRFDDENASAWPRCDASLQNHPQARRAGVRREASRRSAGRAPLQSLGSGPLARRQRARAQPCSSQRQNDPRVDEAGWPYAFRVREACGQIAQASPRSSTQHTVRGRRI